MTTPTRSEHLLPPNATPLERALSGSDGRMLAAPHWLIRAVWDIDLCPVHLLPYLAAAWSVDEWDPAWSEAAKRQAIRDAVWIHQHKGTIGALRRAIAQLGLNARVVRWFEGVPRRRAYTFRLYVGLDQVTDWTAELGRRLYRVAIANKAVRSHLESITLERNAPDTTVAIGISVRTRVRIRIEPDVVTAIRPQRITTSVGVATHVKRRLRVGPRIP